ncbi:hypothetical protein ACIQF6_16745 [Kitasatospora sp. NPDC092948]|uniref:hypothetical protein n=1 Tax=Kitasatospora sp. NPDC092948 TaxID=3364088 RepID=UPI0038288379
MSVILAGVLGVALWIAVALHDDPRPDVAKAARSEPARTADRAAAARMDRQLDQLRAALPWATHLGTAVADSCTTDTVPHTGFARTRWTAVTCTRTATAYLAFDGDFRRELGQLDTVLAAAGWKPGDEPGDQPGLVAACDHLHRADGRPDEATVWYTPPIPSDFVLPSGDGAYPRGPSATVRAVQAPGLPNVDDGTDVHDRALENPSGGTYFVDWQPYSRTRLSAAYPAHGAVLAVTVRVPYNT